VERQTVVAAYNATDEAADGLALAGLLAGITDSDVLVTRVLEDMVSSPQLDREDQRRVSERMRATRRAMMVAVPDAGAPPIAALLDPRLARALHDVAKAHDAAYLVLGSSHHSHLGRILFGGSAERVIDGAPCPVAVAPPRFRETPRLEPPAVGAAYDGTPAARHALRHAVDLARAAGLPLRVLTVTRHGHGDDARRHLADAEALVRDWGGGRVSFEPCLQEGVPHTALVAETDGRVGIMVVGSRGRGALQRVLLGSISTALVREARCPVLVVPGEG
jgi:nucleotide-binding universal stress UspA family protein